jgi:hypothetical protein
VAATQRPAQPDRGRSVSSAAAGPAHKPLRKTKKQERLERAIELRTFALKLLGRHGRPIVIVITAQIPGAIADAAAVLRKPIDIDHLLSLTRHLLELEHASNGARS